MVPAGASSAAALVQLLLAAFAGRREVLSPQEPSSDAPAPPGPRAAGAALSSLSLAATWLPGQRHLFFSHLLIEKTLLD